jgi:hypothetical protein
MADMQRLHVVPAHVGYRKTRSRKALQTACQETQPCSAAMFGAVFEQQLHAQAHPQRGALRDQLAQGHIQAAASQFCHGLAHGAHAGQHQAARLGQHGGLIGQADGLAWRHMGHGLGDGMQIAHAVVHDGDHNTPLVDGTSPPQGEASPGRLVAWARARPKALKTVSA